jgi:hypothetical protein
VEASIDRTIVRRHKMQYGAIRESVIAQEHRRDLLRQVGQDRLIRLAKAGRAPGAKAGRPARVGVRVRMMWRRAVV